MAVTGRLADIAQKSAVLFLAGTTGKSRENYNKKLLNNTFTFSVYYMVNISMLVNRRMELKKQGKLHEELVSLFFSCSLVVIPLIDIQLCLGSFE